MSCICTTQCIADKTAVYRSYRLTINCIESVKVAVTAVIRSVKK